MRRYFVLGLFAAGVVRCSGTETDNPAIDPLVPFEGSECKKYLEDEGAIPVQTDGSAPVAVPGPRPQPVDRSKTEAGSVCKNRK